MGNQEVKPASDEEINEYFEQEWFTVSESLDIEKFKNSISDLPMYVGGQIALLKAWDKKKGKLKDLIDKDKKFHRNGIPDSNRRLAFLEHFELKPKLCKASFKAVLDLTNQEELEIAQEDRASLPFLKLTYLNEKGLLNLEMIVHLINKEKMIEYSPVLINSIAILLIYLPVEETFWVVQKMIESSTELLGDLTTKRQMRWYFTFTKIDYFKMIGAFIQSYIDTTKFK